MLKIDIINILKAILKEENILKDEMMSSHTSFKTGGRAEYFVTPETADEAKALVEALREENIKYTVIGNGSNLLVSDKGIDGVVICIGKKLSGITVDGTSLTAEAGALLSRISSVATKNSLTGFEFASGIPGSLGGALVMNAGAYGGEMKDVVKSTTYIDKSGTIKTITEHNFGYRKSVFQDGDVILSSVIELAKGDIAQIKSRCDELNARRREKQPLEYPSAGSTFKRPEGYFASKLIDDANLKGFKLGGAMVSDKHCGFVINYDNATSMDIFNLMKEVKNTVYDKFGVTLEPEVRLIGEFPEF
jgi:UDP-N-acetylmuramate dehydrogenase